MSGYTNEAKAEEAGQLLASKLFDAMLAMKLVAYRREKDIRDAKLLVDRLRLRGLTDVEDVWTFVGGLVPVVKQARARYNLLELWDRHFP